MTSLANLKVSTRLILGFGAVLTLAAVMAVSGYVGLGSLNDSVALAAEDAVPKLIASNEWEVSVLQSARHMRNILIVDGKEEQTKELAALTEEKAKRKGYMEELQRTVYTEQGKAALKIVIDMRADYVVSEEEFMKQAALGDLVAAKRTLLERANPLQLKYIAALETLNVVQKGKIEVARKNASAAFDSARTVSISLFLLAMGVGIAIAIWLTRGMARQLGGEPAHAANLARNVADGDLSAHIELKAGDSTSLMAQLAAMQDSLSQVVSNVRQNAEGVATASAQIAQGNNDLSGRTEEQASALEETAASMEELSSTVKQNADNARQGNQLALSASAVAVKGGEVVGQVVETMKGINDSSKKIADIIGVIDGIAFQTNILALNAAVEAARAGEQGRGFAVVASEVRSLAGRSADAAKEIKALIADSVERVGQGTALVDQAGATMTEVVSSIKRVTDIMGEISAASTEQSAGVAQVGEAVTQMDLATQQNAALVEQSAAAAESLKSQAQQLVQAVAVFQLAQNKGAYLSTAGAHRPAPTAAMLAPSMRAGYAATERRSLNKSQNVKRLPVKGSTTSEPTQVATRKTGTDDDWTSF
jgi:methyl-accepting chemotaxis protein